MARRKKATFERLPQIGIWGHYPPEKTITERDVKPGNWRLHRIVSEDGHYVVIDHPAPVNWEGMVASVIDRVNSGELELPGLPTAEELAQLARDAETPPDVADEVEDSE